MHVLQATLGTAHATDASADLAGLARLFHEYRMFYDRSPDLEAAKRYVGKRLRAGSSHFIKGTVGTHMAGFVHLTESHDTLAMRDAWLLEDFYVAPAYRKRGLGSALLRHAEAFARDTHGSRLSLATAHDNAEAQRLYEAHGYERDEAFATYHLGLT